MKIDLNGIIRDNSLNQDELALKLFPGNKYPKLALNRILKGSALLNTEQAAYLAAYLGVDISTLYTKGWKSKRKASLVVFTKDNFVAEFDAASMTAQIFVDGQLEHTEALLAPSITLKDFLRTINQIVEQLKNKKS